ncbi:MAG: ornithine carbamoyltransferase [Chloroflexi bacterium]|nr:MAG: ornithine carbamoyltransferase [Chloroflexota bacterium]
MLKHFLALSEWPTDELWHIIKLAEHLKLELRGGGNKPILKNKILALVFQKPSLRTRVSFDVGMKQLGGDAIMLGPQEIGLGKRESIADIARVLSGYTHGIMARVFDHAHVVEMAEYASVPVINGLSDAWHPCQAMADLLTIYEHFGRLNGLKMAYVGDGNNMAASLSIAAARFGMGFSIGMPDGYMLPEEVIDRAVELAEESDGRIELVHDPVAAVRNADVVYTDTWVSMGQENETDKRREDLRPYQLNEALLAQAGKHAIAMHCLPAHRGDEITDAVADGPQSVIFQQAENRLHAQKAILVQLMANH